MDDKNSSKQEEGTVAASVVIPEDKMSDADPSFFEARIRNQAENIVYAVFGFPASAVIGRNSIALVEQITAALLAAHASLTPETSDQLGVTPQVAAKLLALRDVIARDDIIEKDCDAWQVLYSIADPTFSSFTPWAALESLAARLPAPPVTDKQHRQIGADWYHLDDSCPGHDDADKGEDCRSIADLKSKESEHGSK